MSIGVVIVRIRSLEALDHQRRDLHQSSYHTSRKIKPPPLSTAMIPTPRQIPYPLRGLQLLAPVGDDVGGHVSRR
jgi:hypothetical protein